MKKKIVEIVFLIAVSSVVIYFALQLAKQLILNDGI